MTETDTVEATQHAAVTAQRTIHLLLEVLGPLISDSRDAAEPTGDDRDKLQAILSRPEGDLAPTLKAVSPEEGKDALDTWFALNDLFDRLGPERLAAVEEQTDFQQLPQDVLQAIDMHLDDQRLSSLGKILAIGQVLFGQRFTQQ